MKRFLRWLSFVLSVVVAALWIRSVFYLDHARFASSNNSLLFLQTHAGRIYFTYQKINMLYPGHGFHWSSHRFSRVPEQFSRYGFHWPQITNLPNEVSIWIPFWIVFLGTFIITATLWYHPLKSRWRGTHRKGFEVEMNTDSNANAQTDHGQDAHATDQSAKSV